MRRPSRSTNLQIEQLEDRLVPTGNLTVTMQGTAVSVVGTNADNGVEISRGANGDLSFLGLNGTRINGRTDTLVIPLSGGNVSDLTVNTGDGNDLIVITSVSEKNPTWPYPPTITPLTFTGAITVVGGAGADSFLFRNVNVGGNLNVQGGAGGDATVTQVVKVGGNLVVQGGPGANSTLIQSTTVAGTTLVAGGAAQDATGLLSSKFTGDVTMNLRAGPNHVSAETNTFTGNFSLPKVGQGFNQLTVGVSRLNTIGGTLNAADWNQTLPVVSSRLVNRDDSGDLVPVSGPLAPAFLLLNVGQQQTPININSATAIPSPSLPAINVVTTTNTNLSYTFTGTTVQLNFPSTGSGNTLTINGNTYRLLQLHFHKAAEHTINGQSFPLELHMVFADASGNLLVLGTLITQGATDNAAFDPLVANPPTAANTPTTVAGPFDPTTLLPSNLQYFAYAGSLTTPPFTEGVSWVVFTNTVSLSAAQIATIEAAIPEANSRPAQPVNARNVFVSA